jgi:CubicO group peptidase (beta-lactamase class C family)
MNKNAKVFSNTLNGGKVRTVFRVAVMAFLVMLVSNPVWAQAWTARHNLSSSAYQSEVNKWVKKGYRVTYVSGYTDSGKERYAALFEKKSGAPWVARHGLSSSAYQQEYNNWSKKGYRLTHISGYSVKGSPKFAAIWEKKNGPSLVARHNLTSSAYQSEVNKWIKKGFRLTHVSGYTYKGSPRFAAIFEKKKGSAWVARHNLSSSAYQKEVNKWVKKGYRVTHVSGYSDKGKDRYAAIFEKTGGPGWLARHAMSSANYQSEFDNQFYTGYRLKKVSGFTVGKKSRFAAIWVGGGFSGSDMKHIDKTVSSFMKKYSVPGLGIAIARNGKLVFARGYGYSNKSSGWRTSPRHLFRIASVSKPLTSVAVMKLMEQGKLKLSNRVFGSGSILGTKYGKNPYKKYVTSTTVKQLLEHTGGGWNNKKNDPMFSNKSYNHSQLISWVLNNRPLDDKPGTRYAYSNFGYCVLGRVIEKKTGQSYSSYMRGYIMKKAGVSGMYIAGDTLKKRRSNEVVYYGQGGEDPYNMKVARMDSHGGWISSPIDLVRFAVRVDGFSTKSDILKSSSINTMTTASSVNKGYAKGWSVNKSNNWWHGGSLPGTESILVRASNGFCWAVIVNTRSKKDGFSGALDKLTWTILGGVKKWPGYDLF